MKLSVVLGVLFAVFAIAFAHEAHIQVANGVPQVWLDGKPTRPRWTYNRTQQGSYGPRNKVPLASTFLMNEPVRREFLFSAVEETNAAVTIHLRLNEYNVSKPVLNWWIDDFVFEDLTDGTQWIPTESFDSPKNNLFSFYPQDDADYQVGWSATGGRENSPCLKITWRNIVRRETDQLPYHAYTVPRKMHLIAGHDYRLSFWSNADATARLEVGMVRALPDYHLCLEEKYDVMQATVLLAKEAGVDFVTTMVECPWPRPGEEPDWRVTDTTMEHILSANPSALIVPRFEVIPPSWWYAEHPEELFCFQENAQFPHHVVESFCSPLWQQEATAHIRMLIAHLEEKYGEHLIGYHPCPNFLEEWFWEGAMESPDRGGYGPREVAAWREWLKRKYVTDEALQSAWHQPEVTLSTAEVPSPERHAICDAEGVFLNPMTCRDIIDHNDFLGDAMADVLLMFAHTVREMCGNTRLVLAFYGYHLETAANFRQCAIGHDQLARVLASPDVDILCSPVSYWDRLEGGGGYVMAPVESVTAAGKLWFMEDDDRTHLAISGDMGGLDGMACARSRWGAQNILLRNLGQQLVRNLGSWWMDLGSWRWFEDPALWKMMIDIEPADRQKLENPVPYRPPVAFFVDERAYSYTTAAVCRPDGSFFRHPAPYQAPLISASRQPLARLGTGVGHYLLTDLLKSMVPEAKLLILSNAWVLNDAERANLKAKCANRFALWCYAPGFVNPEKDMDVNYIQELTGFTVKPMKGNFQQVLGTLEGQKCGLPAEWLVDGAVEMVMAVTEEPGDEVLARWPTGDAAIVLRGNAMYNATTTLPWAVLRRAAQVAGVHLYTDQECIFYTDDHVAVLHGVRNQTVSFTLPAPAVICDAVTGEKLAEGASSIAIPLKFGETRVLHWE